MTITKHRTIQEFSEALPWTIPILWQGTSGVHQLDDERRATLTITSLTIHGGEYNGYKVTIASKFTGEITSRGFMFDHYLTDRADTRTSQHPIGGEHGGNRTFLTVHSCGARWYIAEPARPEQFTEAVEAWIGEWR